LLHTLRWGRGEKKSAKETEKNRPKHVGKHRRKRLIWVAKEVEIWSGRGGTGLPRFKGIKNDRTSRQEKHLGPSVGTVLIAGRKRS